MIDAPLYGAVLRILEWTLAAYDRLGTVRQREGNRLANSAPLDNYPTADGHYVCMVAGSDANFARLCRAMDRAELLERPPLRHAGRPGPPRRQINGIVADWAGIATRPPRSSDAASPATCRSARAYSAADIFADPHMAERGDLVTVEDPVIGPVRQQAPFPRLAGRPPAAPSGAPRLGQHNQEIWCDLVGLSAEELAAYQAEGVV